VRRSRRRFRPHFSRRRHSSEGRWFRPPLPRDPAPSIPAPRKQRGQERKTSREFQKVSYVPPSRLRADHPCRGTQLPVRFSKPRNDIGMKETGKAETLRSPATAVAPRHWYG